ncbi:hypothetical protein [Scytonema sp. NUACC26]|uniref:hypothetical protein n=1 Tax=Scytonema sp. NUACC26 TaxID=3140176 RepID=UPI0038B3D83F
MSVREAQAERALIAQPRKPFIVLIAKRKLKERLSHQRCTQKALDFNNFTIFDLYSLMNQIVV